MQLYKRQAASILIFPQLSLTIMYHYDMFPAIMETQYKNRKIGKNRRFGTILSRKKRLYRFLQTFTSRFIHISFIHNYLHNIQKSAKSAIFCKSLLFLQTFSQNLKKYFYPVNPVEFITSNLQKCLLIDMIRKTKRREQWKRER